MEIIYLFYFHSKVVIFTTTTRSTLSYTPAKLKSSIQEATIRLLELCGDNSNNTPPVILTDFVRVFIALQLHLKSKYPLNFDISMEMLEH